jgi:transcription termination factor Rho
MLRQVAAELAEEPNGPDPIAVLVDPGPEELAEWRREAPQAEIVAAAQARHAEDALAQALRRAESGEGVVVIVDSLTRLSDEFGDADAAKGLLDAGAASLTVVAGLERR